MSARKSGVTLLVAELSKMNAFKEAEESLTYLLPTTRTFLRYITGKGIYPHQTYGVQAQVAHSVSASSKAVRQVSVPWPLSTHGDLAKAFEAFRISPAIGSDYCAVDVLSSS